MATADELRQSLTEILAVLTREQRHPELCVLMQQALASGLPCAMEQALVEFDKLSTMEIMRIRRETESGADA